MLSLDGRVFFNLVIYLFIFGNQNQKTGGSTLRILDLRSHQKKRLFKRPLEGKKQKKKKSSQRGRGTLAWRPSCRGVARARQREGAASTRRQIAILKPAPSR